MNRRALLKSGCLAVFSATLGGLPTFIPRAALAATPKGGKKKILVSIFQRGAMDGLMAVQPQNDANLVKLRSGLIVPASSAGREGLLNLDDRFGIHPAGSALHKLYQSKQLCVVHGIGSPDNTRSHFDAQDYMETGTPGRKGTANGWLNRAVGLLGHEATPFQSVSLTNALPRSLYGDYPSLAVGNLDEFKVQAGTAGNQSLESLYSDLGADPKAKPNSPSNQGDVGKMLKRKGTDAFEATRIVSTSEFRNYKPANGADYPKTNLGRSLRQVAQLIKAGVGLEIAFTEQGGWDTHVGQGTVQGTFSRQFRELSDSIAAFWTDLGDAYQDQVVLMTMTEFGRTVHQNGSNGTDHGRGSCMFVLGHNLKGGKVYGKVPELALENLEDKRDLPVTTDFRSLFTDVAEHHLGVGRGAASQLFPGYNGNTLGVFS